MGSQLGPTQTQRIQLRMIRKTDYTIRIASDAMQCKRFGVWFVFVVYTRHDDVNVNYIVLTKYVCRNKRFKIWYNIFCFD